MAEESNNNEVYRTMLKLGDKLLAQLIAEIQSQKLIASNTLINSLNYRVIEAVKFVEYKLQVRGIDYALPAFNGRRPGKMPPLANIKSWCRFKGIPESRAYPIARNIGRFGIPNKNVLRNVLKSNVIKEFEANLKEAYSTQLENEIRKIIREK